jgi:hypothetical protein
MVSWDFRVLLFMIHKVPGVSIFETLCFYVTKKSTRRLHFRKNPNVISERSNCTQKYIPARSIPNKHPIIPITPPIIPFSTVFQFPIQLTDRKLQQSFSVNIFIEKTNFNEKLFWRKI